MDVGKTIHPHPTLGESIAMAAEVALRLFSHNLHCDPCMGLSRTGQVGQSIYTTSISVNHCARGSIPDTLPGGHVSGTHPSQNLAV